MGNKGREEPRGDEEARTAQVLAAVAAQQLRASQRPPVPSTVAPLGSHDSAEAIAAAVAFFRNWQGWFA